MRRRERVLHQELHGFFLPRFGNQGKHAAFLADHFLLAVEPADNLRHVVHFELPLAQHAAVDFGEILVGFAFFPSRGRA